MSTPHESKYKREDNWGEEKDCSSPEYEGTKSSTRPQVFCKPLTCLDDVTIEPAKITVGGYTFVPRTVTIVTSVTGGGGTIGPNGGTIAPPTVTTETHVFLVATG